MGKQRFYICPDVQLDIIRVFFNFRFSSRKSQSQQKLAKKITLFTVSFKKPRSFYKPHSLDIDNSSDICGFTNFLTKTFLLGVRKNISIASFLDAQEVHSWRTLKANVCIFLHISLRKCLFQRRSEILSAGKLYGERLNNFFKAALCGSFRRALRKSSWTRKWCIKRWSDFTLIILIIDCYLTE